MTRRSCSSWASGLDAVVGGRLLIRYDHPEHTGDELIADVAGVLDAFGIHAARLAGVSAGGAFAQLLALDFPDRVLSLVPISSSPAVPVDASCQRRSRRPIAYLIDLGAHFPRDRRTHHRRAPATMSAPSEEVCGNGTDGARAGRQASAVPEGRLTIASRGAVA